MSDVFILQLKLQPQWKARKTGKYYLNGIKKETTFYVLYSKGNSGRVVGGRGHTFRGAAFP